MPMSIRVGFFIFSSKDIHTKNNMEIKNIEFILLEITQVFAEISRLLIDQKIGASQKISKARKKLSYE